VIEKNRLAPLLSTVNIEDASYTNSVGGAALSVVWADPDFDSTQSYFYYVRVLEIHTPRWPAYDVKRLGAKSPQEEPWTIQERAYTAPIWYTP
jgi:hypothetical protein